MFADSRLLEQLEGSTCFGLAHDPKARECKMCDLQQDCAARSAGNNIFDKIKVLNPETEEALQKAEELKRKPDAEAVDSEDGLTPRQRRKKRKKELNAKIGMPDTKKMTVEELWEAVKEKGGTCDTYENPSTQKMRLSIALKECYIREYEEKHGSLDI